MSLAATYDPVLNRVHLVASTWGATVTYVVVDRFDNTALTNATIVRGGSHVPMVTGQVLTLDDYEFTPGIVTTYRVRAYNASNVEVATYTYTAAITVTVVGTWFKSVTFPFLNRTITVTDFDELTRPARGGVFDVLGRRLPVAVTEVRGSRRFALTLRAANKAEAEAITLLFSFGDVLLFQPPAGCNLPDQGYFFIGDTGETRPPRHDSTARYFTLEMTETAAPDPAVIGYAATWTGIGAAYATWAAVVAAFPTWADVASYVSAPSDEVVG